VQKRHAHAAVWEPFNAAKAKLSKQASKNSTAEAKLSKQGSKNNAAEAKLSKQASKNSAEDAQRDAINARSSDFLSGANKDGCVTSAAEAAESECLAKAHVKTTNKWDSSAAKSFVLLTEGHKDFCAASECEADGSAELSKRSADASDAAAMRQRHTAIANAMQSIDCMVEEVHSATKDAVAAKHCAEDEESAANANAVADRAEATKEEILALLQSWQEELDLMMSESKAYLNTFKDCVEGFESKQSMTIATLSKVKEISIHIPLLIAACNAAGENAEECRLQIMAAWRPSVPLKTMERKAVIKQRWLLLKQGESS
jgi:hypothetical protein